MHESYVVRMACRKDNIITAEFDDFYGYDGQAPFLFDSEKAAMNFIEVLSKIHNGKVRVEIFEDEYPIHPIPIFDLTSYLDYVFKEYALDEVDAIRLVKELNEGIIIFGKKISLIPCINKKHSNEFIISSLQAIQKYIKVNFGDDYLPKLSSVFYKDFLICPLDPFFSPEVVRNYLSFDQFQIYNCIWRRAISSQMSNAECKTRVVDFCIVDSHKEHESNRSQEVALFSTKKEEILTFNGFTLIDPLYKLHDVEASFFKTLALSNGDEIDILEIWVDLIEISSEADFSVSNCKLASFFLEYSPKDAVYFLEKEAGSECEVCMESLIHLYLDGKVIPHDYKKAVSLAKSLGVDYLDDIYWANPAGSNEQALEDAALGGHPGAQYYLGILYENKNDILALNWYLKAVELDHPGATYRIGMLYSKGLCVQSNKEMSDYWISKAKKLGYDIDSYRFVDDF